MDVVTCVLLFRGPFTMVLFLGLLSLNFYIWRYVGINHVLIFELNPRNFLAAVQILEISVVFGCILSLLTLAFLHSQYLGMPPYVFPLAMPIIMIVFLINPIRIFHYQSRMWLLRYLVSELKPHMYYNRFYANSHFSFFLISVALLVHRSLESSSWTSG